MPAVTLSPVANINVGSHWIATPGPRTSAWAEIADGSDSSYIQADASGRNATFQLATPSDPNFNVATTATIVARLLDPNVNGFSFQVFKSDGVTPLTSSVSCNGGASFATVSASATLSGSQTLSDWTNAQIVVTANDDSAQLAELSVSLTYTSTVVAAETPVLGAIAATVAGGSAGPGGFALGGAAGARRVQGFRFTYNQQRNETLAPFRALTV